MKIICNQSKLNNVLGLVSRAVPSRPSHPALANLKFTADSNGVSVTAFDLSLGITAKVESEVIDFGSICLPASLLFSIISKMPNSDICLEIVDEKCLVSCGQGQYSLISMSADEFPELPTIDNGLEVRISGDVFLEGLKVTLNTASADETKQVLTGVNIATKNDLLKFAATDGHRLSVASFGLEYSAEFEMTIPRKTLTEVQRVLSGSKHDEIDIFFKDNQIIFKLEDILIVSRILGGEYPKYEQLIPKDFGIYVTVDRKEILTSVDRVSVLADTRNNLILCQVNSEDQTTSVSVETADVGAGKETLSTQNSGDSIDIAFNGKYLTDALKSFSSQEVQIGINTPQSPSVFKPLGNIDALYLLMPVQIRK